MDLIPITTDATAFDIWALINGFDGIPLCRFCNEPCAEPPAEDSRYPGFSHPLCLNAQIERNNTCPSENHPFS